ncbi:MAG: hypothetical protein V3V05_10945 [Pontiella sp.]
MKSKLAFFVVVLPAFLITNSLGRVGQSEMESINLYGNGKIITHFELIDGLPTYQYSYDGWTIYQAILRNKVVKICYTKEERKEISSREITAILEAESPRKHWKNNSAGTWNCADRKIAQLTSSKKSLYVEQYWSPEMKRYLEMERKRNMTKFLPIAIFTDFSQDQFIHDISLMRDNTYGMAIMEKLSSEDYRSNLKQKILHYIGNNYKSDLDDYDSSEMEHIAHDITDLIA